MHGTLAVLEAVLKEIYDFSDMSPCGLLKFAEYSETWTIDHETQNMQT
jgi:hypothetical protein